MLAETVTLAWLDGVETVILAQRESRQPVRAVFCPGERGPAPQTAAGLILLAVLPPNTLHVHLSPQVHDLMPTLSYIHTTGWSARLACIGSVIPVWYEWANRCMWVTASPEAW